MDLLVLLTPLLNEARSEDIREFPFDPMTEPEDFVDSALTAESAKVFRINSGKEFNPKNKNSKKGFKN